MDSDQKQQLFAAVQAFEWDESKHLANIEKHGVDFVDAKAIFDQPFLVTQSERHGEMRYMVFGFVDQHALVVICTLRKENCRIISARKARKDEREKYHNRLPR